MYKVFLAIILVIGTIILSISNVYAQKESIPDVIFVTTNSTAESFSEHEFNITINNITSHKGICKSKECTVEVIKLSDNGLSTGIVSPPDPTTQSMNSGVDIRIHDAGNNGMPEMKREFQERWSIWGNCEIGEIEETVFVCGHDTYDTITLSNKLQDIELMLPLTEGKYDTITDKIIFTANFKSQN